MYEDKKSIEGQQADCPTWIIKFYDHMPISLYKQYYIKEAALAQLKTSHAVAVICSNS